MSKKSIALDQTEREMSVQLSGINGRTINMRFEHSREKVEQADTSISSPNQNSR